MEKALHIESKKEDISPLVLFVGDPLRAKYIAQTYLLDPILVNKVRNMYGYTGLYKGVRISVMSHGMGMPSMGIYAQELFEYYDVSKVIRIGTCGALSPKESVRDIVLGTGFYTRSNFSLSYCNEDIHYLEPDGELLSAIDDSAKQMGVNIVKGTIITTDTFGPYLDPSVVKLNSPDELNPVGEEMEGFALMLLANKFKKQAACMATIVDNKFTGEAATPEEREKSLNNMIKVALETIIK